MATDFQIVRSLLETTPLIHDTIEIILDILQELYEGQYKRVDLWGISEGTHSFMLNITVSIYHNFVYDENFEYEGDIDVIRDNSESESTFNFKFTADGIQYEWKNGYRIGDITLEFFVTEPHSSYVTLYQLGRKLKKN